MTEREASKTALGVAILRAAHMLFDGEPKILNDTIVVQLLGAEFVTRARERPDAFADPRSMALRAHVLLRSRYAEERLREAVGRGVRQFVSLGAGLDTFSYRQPPWASALRVFEVDHPASQDAKRARLAATGIAVPANVTFAPIDFENDTLAIGLARAGFDSGAPAFISCLGVLVYLTGDAIAALFAFVASLPSTSECVFTFGGRGGADDPTRQSLADKVAALGEPFESVMSFDDVRAVLARAGLPEPARPTAEEIASYLGARSDGLARPKRESIAAVVVP
jgi:methyltransferase (TIGR00027 family)